MTCRVTGAAVKQILETDLTAVELQPFIIAANALIDARIPTAELSPATLKEIERWLAAHFACAKDPRAQSEKIGNEYQVSYTGTTGAGLMATIYGQTAVSLDRTGSLAASEANGGAKRARFQIATTPAHGSFIRTDD